MDEFEQRWLAFVRRFADAPAQERDALVADVLEHGLPEAGSEHLLAADLPTADRVAAEMAVVAASGDSTRSATGGTTRTGRGTSAATPRSCGTS